MTPGSLLALLGAWAVVGLVPGLLVVTGLRWRGGWLRTLGLAPLASFGLLMAVAVVLSAVHAPITALTVLVPAYVLGGLCLAIGLRARGNSLALELRPVDLVPLALAACISVAIWWTASDGLGAVPPNDDGSNHGLFATQILGLHTIDPTQVVVGSVTTGQPHAHYYPLALHLVAALTSALSGAPVAAALTLQVVVAAVLLPAGMFVLTRRLFPERPGAAGVAALFAVMFAAMPYYVVGWGGLPFIVGMCLLPIAIDAVAGAGRDGAPLATGVLAGLALIGLFALHSSEMVSALALGVLLVIGALVRRDERPGDALSPIGFAVLLMLAFLAPQWAQVRAGAGDVAVASLIPPAPLLDSMLHAVTYLTGVPNPALADAVPVWLHALYIASGAAVWLLALAGVIGAVRSRWSPEWALALGVCMLVVVASSLRLPLIDALTVPWYSRWDRIVMNELVLVAPLAALGVMALTATMRTGPALYAVTGGVAVAVAAPSIAVSSYVAHAAYDAGSLASPPQRAAFAWLAEHARPGESVLNDAVDGSCWMWSLNGVVPLFAVAPHQIDGWGTRRYLLAHAAEVNSDPLATSTADQWKVRYAYVGPRAYPQRPRAFTVRSLVAGGGWRVVYQQDGATVLERVAG